MIKNVFKYGLIFFLCVSLGFIAHKFLFTIKPNLIPGTGNFYAVVKNNLGRFLGFLENRNLLVNYEKELNKQEETRYSNYYKEELTDDVRINNNFGTEAIIGLSRRNSLQRRTTAVTIGINGDGEYYLNSGYARKELLPYF